MNPIGITSWIWTSPLTTERFPEIAQHVARLDVGDGRQLGRLGQAAEGAVELGAKRLRVDGADHGDEEVVAGELRRIG